MKVLNFPYGKSPRKFVFLRPVTMNGTQVGESQPEGVLREKRAKGQMQRRKHLTDLGILKVLYCLPVTVSVPATCWALWVSPTNSEDL